MLDGTGVREAAPLATDEQLFGYIAEMCAELRDMANRPRFRTIRYLLDMARLEAQREAKAKESPAPLTKIPPAA